MGADCVTPNRSFMCTQLVTAAMPRLSPAERERVIGRLQAGDRPGVVANAFRVHLSTVYRLQARFQATGSTRDRPRPGQPRVTTARQDRHIRRVHRRDRFLTAAETARNLLGTRQRPVSADTVRRRLAAANLRNRRPARRPVLTPRHRMARLQWAQGRIRWRHQQWRQVLFTDESRFCVDSPDGRVRIWRPRNERFADASVLERNAWGGPSVMIWGGIALNRRLGPVFFQNVGQGRGNGVNAQRYIQQVIRPHVIPFLARHQNMTFQQDNARPHAARVTHQVLQQHNVRTMPWPALSPDLNPIEHFWDELQRQINQVRPRPATAAALRQAILQAWANIPMARVNRLIHSMYRRCRAVINANGGHTRY